MLAVEKAVMKVGKTAVSLVVHWDFVKVAYWGERLVDSRIFDLEKYLAYYLVGLLDNDSAAC